jgi:hypothetical protein
MAEAVPTLTRHDLEAKIVKRSWENEAFRKDFTTDPAGVFVKYWAVPAASLPKIVIHQEALGSWHIVLPMRPANTNELSEQDLERVAGGWTPPPLALVTATATTASGAAASITPVTSFIANATQKVSAAAMGTVVASLAVDKAAGW